MSYWNAKYKNDYGEYEITFASKQKEETKAIEKLCQAIIDKKVKSVDDVIIVRHGQWIIEMDDMGWLKHTCPNCGYVKRTDIHVSLGWNYCPNCGTKMDLEG